MISFIEILEQKNNPAVAAAAIIEKTKSQVYPNPKTMEKIASQVSGFTGKNVANASAAARDSLNNPANRSQLVSQYAPNPTKSIPNQTKVNPISTASSV